MGSTHTYQGVTATLSNIYGVGLNGTPLLAFNVPSPSGGGAVQSLSISIGNGGSGYSTPTALVSVVGYNGSNAVVQVSTNGSGSIIPNTYTIINSGGSGYVNNNPVTLNNYGGSIPTTIASGTITTTPSVAGTSYQAITLQVTNNNAVTCNNIQLVLGLAVVDSNGNSTTLPAWLPSGQNIAVNSGGFGASWTFQNISSPNIWVFSNTSTTNMFGMGAISLVPGQTQTFTQNVQISNSTVGGYQTFYLYPIIRVISFTG
jgi:hypothetical protein